MIHVSLSGARSYESGNSSRHSSNRIPARETYSHSVNSLEYLIQRFGVNNVILTGLALMAASVAVALNGITVAHFVVALALVGIGWNFMYTGGTTLLAETHAPSEKARTQGLNDFIVFATMGISSLASGALVTTSGWETMNRAALPLLALIAIAVLWLMWARRQAPAAAA